MLPRLGHSFSSKEEASFNFVAAVTIHSDFGAQENKICHCFHFPLSICHKVMGLDAMIFREGNGTPLQYSCLENPMDGGAW